MMMTILFLIYYLNEHITHINEASRNERKNTVLSVIFGVFC